MQRNAKLFDNTATISFNALYAATYLTLNVRRFEGLSQHTVPGDITCEPDAIWVFLYQEEIEDNN